MEKNISPRLIRLLQQNENIHLEFKKAATSLPSNLFETICAMLNSEGGDILLGVFDNGTVVGVQEDCIARMITDLVNLSNNPLKIDPPFILFPQVYIVNDRKLIHIQVPPSSQVHSSGKIIYDRSNDGDFKVEQPHRIAEIANRKRNHYTESIVYPALQMTDFKTELFQKIRNLIGSHHPDHPWLSLDNEKMLEVAGLWKKDFQTGRDGYTLAAALLLGKDAVIQQIIPHYKIDALVRIDNMDRYDDRLYIQTNLVDAHDLLMDFIARHLPDRFYLKGDQRISLRATIFREIVANLIIHREYTSAAPAIFTIYADRVETLNANNPHGEGPIDSDNFAPFPKNPTIAKFFIQLGRAEELGSGILTASRLSKDYAGKGEPVFIEGDRFKTIIPIPGRSTSVSENYESDLIYSIISDTVNDTVNDPINDIVRKRLVELVCHLYNQPGLRVAELASVMKTSGITIKRDMQKIRSIAEYKGSQKLGGYFLTQKILSKLTAQKND